MKLIKTLLQSSALLLLGPLQAIDYAPWHPPMLQVQSHLRLQGQFYRKVAKSKGSFKSRANDFFATASAGSSYYDWYAEGVLQLAATRTQSPLDLDHGAIHGKYRWLDDVDASSPISLATGIVVSGASKRALRDKSSFHHGQGEVQAYLTLGKEWSKGCFWCWRSWGMCGLGVADQGSPWLHLSAAIERNHANRWQQKLYLDYLQVFCCNSISACHFRGYGPIKHQSLDLTGSFHYATDCDLVLSAALRYRLWAKNFPCRAVAIELSMLYPFGL